MQPTYDLWLVACSYLVAVAASYAALELAGRVAASSARASWVWIAAGSAAMGLGIWSMHFIGMLAFHLPIPLTYDLSITALSVVPAILASALALGLIRGGSLSGLRLALGAVVMGGGIATMHYIGMAAIPVVPAIRYDPLIFAASIAASIAVAYAALWLAFSLSGSRSGGKKLGAALVMGAAVCAMHYTGMAAANFAPESVCVASASAIGGPWLAETVALNTLVILLAVMAITVLDARRSDQNARAAKALKAANEELRESEARFRDLTDLSSDWYWEQDENLRFTWMSGGVLKKLGWDPQSFIGKSRWDFALLVDDAVLAEHKALLVAHKPFHDFVYGRRNPDGTISYVSTSGMPLFDHRGAFRGYRGTGRDVTEREKAEQEVLRAREQLRLALVGSKLALFEWSLTTGEVFLSERWAEMVGERPGPTTTTIDALTRQVHPDDVEGVKALVVSLIKGQTSFYDAEHRVRTAAGAWIWVRSQGQVVERDSAGRAVRASGTNTDITRRKQSEKALLDAHERLTVGVKVLERRNREIALLGELSNFLISCVTVEEACNAIPRYAQSLFPEEQGALFLFRASRDYLTVNASWGSPSGDHPPFRPDDCWALRRGRIHAVADPAKDPICAHVAPERGEAGKPYLCVPLIVQSELLGLLWIGFRSVATLSDEFETGESGKRQLAVSLSEQIALALSNIRLRDNLRQQTIRDSLTGLYNRRFLEESLNREIARSKRSGAPFALLVIDVDHFKRFNDTYGHDAGDAVLHSVGRALQEVCREGDIACRFGGEEFVIVLPDTDRQGATVVSTRVLELVRSLNLSHGGRDLGQVTVSLGLATFPENGDTMKAIIQSADKALYAAKAAGRNRMMAAGQEASSQFADQDSGIGSQRASAVTEPPILEPRDKPKPVKRRRSRAT